MNIISTKEISENLFKEIKNKFDTYNKINPYIVGVVLSNDKGIEAYSNGLKRDCEKIGIGYKEIRADPNIEDFYNILDYIQFYNEHPFCIGFIFFEPIPGKWERLKRLVPFKNLDTKTRFYYPATVEAVHHLLNCEESKIEDVQDKNVVIVGRSETVGKPMAKMFTELNANVVQCHSFTSEENLKTYFSSANIIVLAANKENLVNEELNKFIHDDAIIIDIGGYKDVEGNYHGCYDTSLFDKNEKIIYNNIGRLTRLKLLDNAYIIMTYLYD